jgi:hypothetical protein
MTASRRIRETLVYVVIVIATFIVLQAVLVIMHEFTHSTVAWLLGYMRSPLGIVWGNPLTLDGWDEGVHYSELFASGHLHAAAIIGVSPLIVHAAIVTLGLVLMQRKDMQGRKWLFHTIFWFVIANLMELINYIIMRSWATHGDTGNFNRGMGLSPWFIFIVGSLAIVVGLYFLFRETIPRMYAIFARGNRPTEWAILVMTAFFLFIWGSGIRVVFDVYPNPQWMFGLLGFAAFVTVLVACSPSRTWVISRTRMG